MFYIIKNSLVLSAAIFPPVLVIAFPLGGGDFMMSLLKSSGFKIHNNFTGGDIWHKDALQDSIRTIKKPVFPTLLSNQGFVQIEYSQVEIKGSFQDMIDIDKDGSQDIQLSLKEEGDKKSFRLEVKTLNDEVIRFSGATLCEGGGCSTQGEGCVGCVMRVVNVKEIDKKQFTNIEFAVQGRDKILVRIPVVNER